MKYCQKCGAECEDGINFCGSCGAPQTDTADASAAAIEEATTEKNEAAEVSLEDLTEEAEATEKAKVPPYTPYEPETIIFAGNRGVKTPAPAAAKAPLPNPAKIETHLVKAIVSTALTVFCCFIPLPFGIIALIFAVQADARLKAKDYGAALEAGKKANIWGNLTIAISVMILTFWIVFYVMMIVGMISEGTRGSLLDLYHSR